jgi:MipA family protein
MRWLVALLVPAMATGAATAAERPLWELGAGVAGLRLPHYRGADQSRNWLLPVPYVVYRGEILRADRDGARALLFESERVEFDLSVAASAPTRSDENGAREGMSDLAPTVEIGPNLNLRLAEGRGWKLDLRAPLRAAVTIESKPQGIGWVASPNLNLDLRTGGAWQVGVQTGLLYGSRRFNGYFYDVPNAAATSARPAYRASSGYAGAQFTLAASRRDGDRWLGAFARVDHLGGARFTDSPLLRQRTTASIGVAVSWVFARSARLVTVDD